MIGLGWRWNSFSFENPNQNNLELKENGPSDYESRCWLASFNKTEIGIWVKGLKHMHIFCMFLSEELMICDCSPVLSIREMPLHPLLNTWNFVLIIIITFISLIRHYSYLSTSIILFYFTYPFYTQECSYLPSYIFQNNELLMYLQVNEWMNTQLNLNYTSLHA